MLSIAEEKLVLATHTKKGRQKSGLLLVEGKKLLHEAKEYLEFTFDENNTDGFKKLVTTYTPQMQAGVARIPNWSLTQIKKKDTIIVLDHIQDPGNLGTILRSALGFGASLLLVECVDPGNPKVVRSSAGTLFHVPWMQVKRKEAVELIESLDRPIHRLELRPHASTPDELPEGPQIIIAGSEGAGITLDVQAPSLTIPHNKKLESLNVSTAVSVILYELRK